MKAPRWGIYRKEAWGCLTLLGRVRAHTREAAENAADASRRFAGWDTIRRIDGEPNTD